MNCPVVQTSLGKISGQICTKPKKPNAKTVFRYANIPFAKPPVETLRFCPPQDPESWEGILDGTKISKSPVQTETMSKPFEDQWPFVNDFNEDWQVTGEDCLYLNVFTSNVTPKTKLPVLFWIYGGAFTIGTSQCYDGNVLASLHDVIVVVPNYRVNAFGFLSFPGDNSPCKGNLGLLDQVKALEWVRDHISNFGGDPNNVTIFGESAGAISCSLHLMSPLSKGLFHRAISHSGTCVMEMMVTDDNKESIKLMLQELKIEETDPHKIIQELRKIPADKLAASQDKATAAFQFISPIKHDGVFLTKPIAEIIKSGEFNKVPYIIGQNTTECHGMSPPGGKEKFNLGLTKEDFEQNIGGFLNFMAPAEKVSKILIALTKTYEKFLDKNSPKFWSMLTADAMADMFFLVGTKSMCSLHANAAPTYLYEMSQQPTFHHDKSYSDNDKLELKSPLCDCDHGDDIFYTFGMPLSSASFTFPVRFTENEKQFSYEWQKYLVNFAHSGNPNKGPYKMNVKWSKYNKKDDNYLQANVKFSARKGLRKEQAKFWTETMPAMLK